MSTGRVIKHPKTGQEFWLEQKWMGDNPYHGVKRSKPTSRKYIVPHHTAGNMGGDLAVLRGKTKTKVSAKYLVSDPDDGDYRDRKGRLIIYQLLRDDFIGWSVGATTGKYGFVNNSNSDSIEVSYRGKADDYDVDQVAAVEALVAYEEARLHQNLTVLSHAEIAPNRKDDPHKSFPLARVKALALAMAYGVLPRPKVYATASFVGVRIGIRERKEVSSKVLAWLANGDRVQVLGRSLEWTRVSAKGVVGYVFTRHLKF